ncbi:hypothetical protein BDD12DRAFT_849770 [Trichophaea hybrida]|nr:hypothetical protein BDD12DRAFT_849770 [Trichophaea hybrida]
MPVTFQVAEHSANPIPRDPDEFDATLGSSLGGYTIPKKSIKDVLRQTAPDASFAMAEIFQTSFQESDLPDIMPSRNGLVYCCIESYNKHHNLVLRPDDVWHTIISQFSLYVNANSEKMRSYFVDHEGKRELEVRAIGSRYSVDFGEMAKSMGKLLDENIKDKSLLDWVLPSYSTSTPNDTIIGSILMMCTLKKYFSYKFMIMCGIPSITLLGTQDDWINLHTRLDKLLEFGPESEHPDLHAWHSLLSPTITHFVNAFEVFSLDATATAEPNQKDIRNFFGRICHEISGGSGPTYISGWITFFCAFDEHGKWQLQRANAASTASGGSWNGWNPKIDMNDIPPSFGEVDVKVDDNGTLFDTVMIAGVVGYEVLGEGENRNTLTPYTGWWMFTLDEEKARELKEEEDRQAEEERKRKMSMAIELKPRGKARRRSKKKKRKQKVQAEGAQEDTTFPRLYE